MRRARIVVLFLLAWPGTATAAPPALTVEATPQSGPAPLHVVLAAAGNAVAYHWDFGDGTSADGGTVEHVYGPGRFTARVTATGTGGETAQAEVSVVSLALTLQAKHLVSFGSHLTLHGRIVPALAGVRVRLSLGSRWIASARTHADGRFRIGAPVQEPGSYLARLGDVTSNPVEVLVRPRIRLALVGSGELRRPLYLTAAVRPATAGFLRAQIWRDGRELTAGTFGPRLRLRLPTGRASLFRIALSAVPQTVGFTAASRSLVKAVYSPDLSRGALGPSVRALETRLATLHYALRGIDSSFGADTADAVIAFQQLHGLARTGVADRRFWRLLASAGIPRARNRGNHIEVDDAPGALRGPRRTGGARRPRLDRGNRQYAGRRLACLQQGSRLELGALVPLVLPARLCDPRLPGRAAVSGKPRVRARADVDRATAVRDDSVRRRRSTSTDRRCPYRSAPWASTTTR